MKSPYVIKSGGDGIVMGVFWGMVIFSIVKFLFLTVVHFFLGGVFRWQQKKPPASISTSRGLNQLPSLNNKITTHHSEGIAPCLPIMSTCI